MVSFVLRVLALYCLVNRKVLTILKELSLYSLRLYSGRLVTGTVLSNNREKHRVTKSRASIPRSCNKKQLPKTRDLAALHNIKPTGTGTRIRRSLYLTPVPHTPYLNLRSWPTTKPEDCPSSRAPRTSLDTDRTLDWRSPFPSACRWRLRLRS